MKTHMDTVSVNDKQKKATWPLCYEKEGGENNRKIPKRFGIKVPNLKLVTVGLNVRPL